MNHRKALRALLTGIFAAAGAACSVFATRYPEASFIGAAFLAAVGYVYRIHPPPEHH